MATATGPGFSRGALRLANKKTEKAVAAAGIEIWEWFRGVLAKRAVDPLGKQLLEYVDSYTPSAAGSKDYAVWPTVRRENRELAIILGDAGGVAYNSCLAAVHALMLFAERDPAAVDAILSRHGLSRSAAQPDDAMITQSRFFLFQGGVATIDDESEDVELVSRDTDGVDEGGQWRIGELSPAERRNVRAFINRGVCECPACRVPRSRRTRARAEKRTATVRSNRTLPAAKSR